MNEPRLIAITSLLLIAMSCSGPEDVAVDTGSVSNPDMEQRSDVSFDATRPDVGVPDVGMPPPPYPSPPERWPTTTSVTNDVDRDLIALLESDRLAGACDRWNGGQVDEETKMLCGKWMFFYETFGTVGVPTPILTFAQAWYADYYGAGFEKFGFVPDPASPDGMPLGLAETTAKLGSVETRAFTCAACHFGQMRDGRYAVGYGNLDLEYGRFLAGIGAPLNMSLNENSPDVHPDIRAELLPYVQTAKQDSNYQIALATTGLTLLGAGTMGTTPIDEQQRFLDLIPGTMDFLTAPVVDDGVWTVSRILSLWNVPSAEQRAAAGMDHEYLSWTGGTPTLEVFIQGFVTLGLADESVWTPQRIAPLAAYIRSLRTPELLGTPNDESATRGRQAFADAGCATCHNGPSGESATSYLYDELGTDREMAKVFNPNPDGTLCCGFASGPDAYIVTGGIKAPRITGVETQSLWLHNGAVPSLGSLLCLEPRPTTTLLAQTATGHEYGCELDEQTRVDIIEYLGTL